MENKSGRKILQSGHNKILKNSLFTILVISFTILYSTENVYGHGVGSETFPPVELGDKLVTLEVSSSQNNTDQQISISLIDFDSKITLRDVTFLIKSERGNQFLFEQEFKADNGFIVFNFISDNSDIQIQDIQESSMFGSILGIDSRLVNVSGPKLADGGLYKFDISVLTANDYSKKIDEPLIFNAGISIAQTTKHNITDPNFGDQYIDVITFYDEISNFEYDLNSKEISFFMPFEWSESNINQTSVVHEELSIPNTFGDLLVSEFTMYINGIQLSNDIVTIDDFFSEQRVVHFIIYQKELLNIFENNTNSEGMNFVIKPDLNYSHLTSVTENGQFRILVSWEPNNLKSNSNAKIIFDITDIFLKNKPVATNYDFSITQNDKILFEYSGISSDSKDKHNIVEFMIPQDISGIIHLNFNNLDNNKLGKTTIPIVVDRITNQNEISIPEWIRNNALWWSLEQIDDDTFIQGIEYLIKNQIIVISSTTQESFDTQEIPSWIRNNAAWWANGQIDDDTFIQGLKFLIQKGIIQV